VPSRRPGDCPKIETQLTKIRTEVAKDCRNE
jgi:hypothetical protein